MDASNWAGRQNFVGQAEAFNIRKRRKRSPKKKRRTRSPAPSFIDIFAGCGGLSLGLMASGWKGIFAIERDRYAFKTLKENFQSKNARYSFQWPTWLPKKPHDITEMLGIYRPELIKLRGKIDLIAGGPPCQGFSMAGKRRSNDPRNRLFEQYIELVELVRPRIIILENVPGIVSKYYNERRKKLSKPFSAVIVQKLSARYHVFSCVLPLSSYGVPQRRQRYILIGFRKWIFQKKNLVDPFVALDRQAPSFLKRRGIANGVTVKQAISDLTIARNGVRKSEDSIDFLQIRYRGPITRYQRLLNSGCEKPNSLRLANHQKKIERRFARIIRYCRLTSRFNTNLTKDAQKVFGTKKQAIRVLHPNRVAATVTSLPDDMLHYNEPRTLTVREIARIQTFPDWFKFKGKYTTGGDMRTKECPRFTQVANAVPPLLAELLGKVLRSAACHTRKAR